MTVSRRTVCDPKEMLGPLQLGEGANTLEVCCGPRVGQSDHTGNGDGGGNTERCGSLQGSRELLFNDDSAANM